MKIIAKYFLLFFLISIYTKGQNIDILSLEYGILPATQFKDPIAESLNDSEIDIKEYDIGINIPIVLSQKKTFLVNSLSFNLLDFTFENMSNGIQYLGPEKLYSISYRLTLIHNFSKKWSTNILFKPTLASDMENIDSEHYTFQYGGVVVYKLNEHTDLGLGASYNNDFGEPTLLPVLKYKHRMYDKLIVDIILPKYAQLVYLLNNRVNFGIGASISGNHYRISKDESPAKGNSFKYSAIALGPKVKYMFTEKVSLNLSGGILANRIYETYDPSNDQLKEDDLKEGIYLSAGFSYNL